MSDSTSNFHPYYTAMLAAWEVALDSYEGEDAIKKAGTKYLPYTSGQIEDGAGTSNPNALGEKAYNAYKLRAVYPDIYKEAVDACIGIMHRKPPTILLPAAMEEMEENCTLLGESMETLLRRINAQQLTTGRIGVLGDFRTDSDGVIRPNLVTYNEKAIVNWNDTSDEFEDIDLSMVVLDESTYKLTSGLTWEYETSYRILLLGELEEAEEGAGGTPTYPGSTYVYGITESSADLLAGTFKAPEAMGEKASSLPFVFINSKDLSPKPDQPPLMSLARLCLAIYRGEADYRQNLFMQGQDTLVRIGRLSLGDNEPVRTGSGAVMDIPMGGDAKYIGVSSNGLSEQRTALENDYARAVRKSGQLVDATSRAKESGDALRIRVAAQTATLPQIAKTGAAGLEKVLKLLAGWLGHNPDEVSVQPNLDFTDEDLNGETLLKLVQAKLQGAPLSEESIHKYMVEQGMTEKSYEDEMAAILTEEPRV